MRICGKLLSSTENTFNKMKAESGWRQQIDAVESNSDQQAVTEIITANIVKTIQSGGISMIGQLHQNVEAYARDASQSIDIDVTKVISDVMHNL